MIELVIVVCMMGDPCTEQRYDHAGDIYTCLRQAEDFAPTVEWTYPEPVYVTDVYCESTPEEQ